MNNLVDIHIGNRVHHLRIERKLSCEQLAKKAGVSLSQLNKYEAGEQRIGSSRLYDLSRALDISVGYFFEGLGETATIESAVSQVNNAHHNMTRLINGKELSHDEQDLVRQCCYDLQNFMDATETVVGL